MEQVTRSVPGWVGMVEHCAAVLGITPEAYWQRIQDRDREIQREHPARLAALSDDEWDGD